MCHSFDLEDRLPADSATLAPADILVTKLQIFEVNDKDLIDSIALLLSHPVIFAVSQDCGSGLRAAGSGIRGAGSVAGLGQHLTQVDNCLGVDVFVAGRLEVFGLGPDGHGHLAAVPLLG
jgi:hypothetical protein